MSTTDTTSGAPPSVKDLLDLARADRAEQEKQAQAQAVSAAANFVTEARNAVARVLELGTADAQHLLTVTIPDTDSVHRPAHVAYQAAEGGLTFRYSPGYFAGGGEGFRSPKVQLLKTCPECGGFVLAHDPMWDAHSRAGIGLLLMHQYDALHDPGHDEQCSLAWKETDEAAAPFVQPAAPTVEESLARIATAVEEIAGRWPS